MEQNHPLSIRYFIDDKTSRLVLDTPHLLNSILGITYIYLFMSRVSFSTTFALLNIAIIRPLHPS